MRRRRKFDTIKLINRALDRAIDRMSMPPRRQPKGRDLFSIFMDAATGAPKRRR